MEAKHDWIGSRENVLWFAAHNLLGHWIAGMLWLASDLAWLAGLVRLHVALARAADLVHRVI